MTSRAISARVALVFGALAAVVGGGACSGPNNFDDFRGQLNARWCAHEMRCGAVGLSEPQHCGVPVALAGLGPASFDLAGAVRRGSMQFQSIDAQSCLDAIKDAPCDGSQSQATVGRYCHGVVTAQLPVGHACLNDVECQGGACVPTNAAAPACGGSCVAWVPTNSACDPTSVAPAVDPSKQCDPTVHFCDDGGICRKKKMVGDSCAHDAECAFFSFCVGGHCGDFEQLDAGAACSTTDSGPPCRVGLFCDDGHCATRHASGAPCSLPGDCADGLACITGSCAGWLDAGAACSASLAGELDTSGCPATQSCTAGSCQLLAADKLGPEQSCGSNVDACSVGLACESRVCVYQAGLGGDCADDTACAAGLACDHGSGTCASPVSCSATP